MSVDRRSQGGPACPTIARRVGGSRTPIRGGRGATLVEATLAAALLAILIIPLARLFRGGLAAFSASRNRSLAAGASVRTQLGMDADFRNMNEIYYAGPGEIRFYMDRNAGPAFDPKADQDNDGIPNVADADDDNDAFLGDRSVAERRWSAEGLALAGWRQGLDRDDDDDDGDDHRDLRAAYVFDPAAGTVRRDLWVNDQLKSTEILIDQVLSCRFYCFCRASAPGAPGGWDANGDGFIVDDGTVNELDRNNSGDLEQFDETRWIGGFRYAVTIRTSPQAAPFSMESTVMPPLMEIKEKFP
jgi:hypothetical protein